MATNTKNYGLVKPNENEVADVGVINQNMDSIDGALKQNAENILTESRELNILNVERGYLNGKLVSNTDIDSLRLNGKYIGVMSGTLPTNIHPAACKFLDITGGVLGDYTSQTLSSIDTFGNYKKWIRSYDAASSLENKWGKWQEIAMTDNVLPLTGGVLSGDLFVSKNNNPSIHLSDIANAGRMTEIFQSNNLAIFRNAKNSSNFTDIIINSQNEHLSYRMVLTDNINGNYSSYKIYGEHNITISQTSPTTTLANGCMHNVY